MISWIESVCLYGRAELSAAATVFGYLLQQRNEAYLEISISDGQQQCRDAAFDLAPTHQLGNVA